MLVEDEYLSAWSAFSGAMLVEDEYLPAWSVFPGAMLVEDEYLSSMERIFERDAR